MTMLPVIVILCALCGFLLALFIHIKKKLSAPIVCPIGHSCDPVVHSDYSRFLGIPVEILGMVYYFLILLHYSLFSIFPAPGANELGFVFIGVSALAFLFSLYLTAVQAFILKEWCTWCLISAALCAFIFFAGLELSGVDWSLFLASFLSAKS
ncbi:MAG TPA: hypothetical protein DEF00_02565 [Candidatus Taylorbacteria bacterium]|nr:hypothetical protein [Candidatus Taylorbacteria bacterium]